MALLRVVFNGADSNKVEFKITPESGNNHLVYLVPTTGSLIWNADGTNQTDWTNPTEGAAQYWLPNGIPPV